MAMTPKEVYDAWYEQIGTGQSEAFSQMLRELYSGELTMETHAEGMRIRARTEAEQVVLVPHAYEPGEKGQCQFGGPEGAASGVACERVSIHPIHWRQREGQPGAEPPPAEGRPDSNG